MVHGTTVGGEGGAEETTRARVDEEATATTEMELGAQMSLSKGTRSLFFSMKKNFPRVMKSCMIWQAEKVEGECSGLGTSGCS